jgi:hypothetical protein
MTRRKEYGLSESRIYAIYYGIRTRCENPKWNTYQRYGAKGIVCNWKTFEEFYEDMGKPYFKHAKLHGEKNITIERLNNKGNYELSNCRWATPYEQNRNTSQNRWLEYQGRRQCLVDWGKELGIKRTTLIQRLDAYGWSVEKTLSTPTQRVKL